MTINDKISRLLRRMTATCVAAAAKRGQRSKPYRLEQLEQRQMLTTIDLAALTAAQGSTVFGGDSGDQSGYSVSNAGDVNGDGFDDLIIGARFADAFGNAKTNSGDSYVIFGGASLPSTIDLASLGTAGVTIFGAETRDYSGWSVSSAGDVNGDGFDDLIIGAFGADASGNARNGAGDSYVIFGAASLPSTMDLASLGTAGVTIFGADASDQSARSVSSAGDVNGDGFYDIIIGASLADAFGNAKTNSGDSYVVFGAASLPSTIDLASLGDAGVTIFGADANDRSGRSVSSAGDVNGDGFDDLLIGAHNAAASGNGKSQAGESYVVFGGASLPSTVNLATLGTAGVTILGADATDLSGYSVSNAGDVNGDGFDDLIIGAFLAAASGNAKTNSGDSYVVFGAASLPSTIDLASLGTAGVTIFGADAYDRSGFSVSSAGDVNGEGFDDLIIGARGGDASGNAKNDAGDSYVILGSNFTGAVTNQGTTTADTLTGTSSANVINGGRGNDTLAGNGGSDVLTGGHGNDILAVSDLTFKRVVGGTGSDTLRLDGSGLSLNLTTVKDNRLLGIEQIDITGTGNNTLTLSLRDVFNVSDESNTLIVHGNTADVVKLDSGWIRGADTTINSISYRVFTQGAATLQVGFAVSIITTSTIDLAALTAPQGSTIFGADAYDSSGRSVSSAGDVNGDGFDDLIIGAPFADASGNTKNAAGESYVIFGGASVPATIDLADLGTAGITIFGAESGNRSGISASSAGDVNGDGFDDLIIGAPLTDSLPLNSGGESYVIFGAATLPATIDVSTLGQSGQPAGITIRGANFDDDGVGHWRYDYSGRSVSSAGDINGDGFDDLIIGARAGFAGYSFTYGLYSYLSGGRSYVIFGGTSLPSTIELATLGELGQPDGITISGGNGPGDSGYSVSNAGDVNGDGFDDLLIGAPLAAGAGNARSAGNSYVIFGGAALPSTINLANLGTAGVTIFGADAADRSGFSVSNAGDVNGDGFDDLLIGAVLAGESYLLFGGVSLPSTIDLASLGTSGVTILGTDADDRNCSVSSAGDVNGDGFDDLLIGAGYSYDSGLALRTFTDESYVVFGAALLPPTIDLGNLVASGMTIFGVSGSEFTGPSVSSAGDVNGDGFDDLLIGAPIFDQPVNAIPNAGETCLIFGGNFTNSITHQGTSGVNTLTGSSSANVMNGGRGNDTVLGNGGADVLLGGQGNDILAISDLTFKRVVGGTGSDTLRLDGSGLSLNLTTLKDNRLLGIEQIDITGTGNNTLTLSLRDVLNLSDESNTLTILRNAGDVVNFGTGWTLDPQQLVIGDVAFEVLTQGTARLLIQDPNVVIGTDSNDAFVLTYSSTSPSGTVNVMRSTDGGPAVDLGTFPMTAQVTLNGMAGTDSVRVVGTADADEYLISSSGRLTTNGAGLVLDSVETTTLAGAAGDDLYQFDADTTLGVYTVDEAGGGIDTVDLSPTTTSAVVVNLGTTTQQVVNSNLSLKLSSSTAFEKAIGGSGNDTLTGNSLTNTLTGGSGNDSLIGGSGDDTYVFGTAATAEADTVTEAASAGTDTLSFSSLTTNVILGLETSLVQAIHANRTLKLNAASVVENIVSGSGNDTLSGNSLANTLTGNAGNDRLTGGSGNDSLVGGSGDDTYVFGTAATAEADTVAEATSAGMDRLSFSSLTTDMILSLETSLVQTVHANRTLKLNAASVFEEIVGGSGNDTLSGNALANTLAGNAGNDTLAGRIGDDIYVFGAATTAEADTVAEATSAGTDTLSFSTLTTDVMLGLETSLVQTVHANRTVKLNAASVFEEIVGGSGNDTLSGNSLANTLTGNAGNDKLTGGGGNDSLVGGTGDDNYVFGTATTGEADTVSEATSAGTDTISFSTLATDVMLGLETSLVQTVHANRTLTLNAIDVFENIVGGSGNDELSGNSLANTLTGNAGNDKLTGNGGDDSLVGGSGDDTYVFAIATTAEADTVAENTGAGSDTLSFSSLTTDVLLGLETSIVQTVHANRTLKLNAASVFENIAGGSGNDTLSGNSLANILVGNAGGDTLKGGGGRDILIGGLGLDTLSGGEDEDIVIAGRTPSDSLFSDLNRVLAEWASVNSYATRIVSAWRTACCEHGYPLDFSGRVIGGKALFSRAVGGVGW